MKQAILFILIFSLPTTYLATQTTINYTEDLTDFPNPERGFYQYSSSKDGTLNASSLSNYRDPHSPETDANFTVVNSLVFRYFFLNDFKTSPISQTYLDNMQIDFDAVRTAGLKLIPRFAYTESIDNTNCSSGICPPYGDASKSQILQHIQQIQPYLQNNKDVIAAVQMGLIGIWGENYYTDHFGDASISPYTIETNDWLERNEVLAALLDAVPLDRMVQVRYPQLKQKLLFGSNSGTNTATLTSNQAYNESDIARLGFHNDCFLASDDDFGTFTNYGPGNSNSDTTNLKPYSATDGKYTVVGGETCFENAPWSQCQADGGQADVELRRFHYSYLNSNYNIPLLNSWTATCLEDVKRNLGYRFVLEQAVITDEVQPGQNMSIQINLRNDGYAAPYNQRNVSLILKSNFNGAIYEVELPDDPRFWLTGNHQIQAQICFPSNITYGTYSLFLKLGDPEPLLKDRPEYAIRMANQNIWDATSGYNNLNHSITVNNTANNPNCSGNLVFEIIDDLLAISVISFYAQAINEEDVKCQWASIAEENIEGFYLERSIDGMTFEDVVFMESQGTANTGADYMHIDEGLPSNVYYYRLRQVNDEGHFDYSNIVSISLSGSNPNNSPSKKVTIVLHPNPAAEQLSLNFRGLSNEIVVMNLFDLLGRKINQQTIDINQDNFNYFYDIRSLKNGYYFLNFSTKDETILSKRFLKF